MGREEFEMLREGVVKRKVKRRLGLFIDGLGLDRATRRLDRKVDLSRLVSGLTSGMQPEVARYYTLIPNEDDARQFAFLDAVERAGLEVVMKRLPPKGVKRQVSMDVHIAADLVAFGYGFFAAEAQETEASKQQANGTPTIVTPTTSKQPIKRMANIVCPSREISYGIFMSNQFGVETSLSDFGQYGNSKGGWKGVDRWVDLSTSETIWRD